VGARFTIALPRGNPPRDDGTDEAEPQDENVRP
jgi:hypothetical protein